MLFEKLSDKEKDMISRYIESYGLNPDHASLSQANRAPLDFVLRHWNREKENLYHLLGDNLIIEKHVEIEVDNTRIVRNLEEMSESTKVLHGISYRNIFRSFWSWINRVSYENWEYTLKMRTAYINEGIFSKDSKVVVRDVETEWFLYDHLAKNVYEGTNCVLVLPDTDKPYQVKTGMRLTRLIDRLLKAYPDQDFNETALNSLVDLIAIARTSTHSSFNLCLSIHPLDYMTMSDNDNNWNSCMAWKDHAGDYRQGTVECMNSPATIVAYIKDDDPMDLGFSNDKWANKAWRQLFLVTEGAIVADKGYPFQYDSTVDVVMNWLQELAEKNWSIKYDTKGYIGDNPGTVFDAKGHEVYDSTDKETIELRINWGYMYDDIGTLNRHSVVINKPVIEEYMKTTGYNAYDIQGSGYSECMWCGGEIFTEDGEDEESSHVICDSCSPGEERWQCDECGEYFHRDELTYVSELDVYLCDDCYNEKIFCDDFTGEMNWTDHMKEIYLALGLTTSNEIAVLKHPISISDDVEYTEGTLGRFFKDPENIATYITPVSNHHRYRWEPEYKNLKEVIFIDDLTEAGKNLFLSRTCYESFDDAREDYCVSEIPVDYIANLERNVCPMDAIHMQLDDNAFTHHFW